jgi:hypothetical protein
MRPDTCQWCGSADLEPVEQTFEQVRGRVTYRFWRCLSCGAMAGGEGEMVAHQLPLGLEVRA